MQLTAMHSMSPRTSSVHGICRDVSCLAIVPMSGCFLLLRPMVCDC